MTQAAFDYWLGVLKTHFPAHPMLGRVGMTFLPRLPEEAEAMKEAHSRAQPVVEMTDQDGARRAEPDLQTASEWLDCMKAGDTLEFRRRDGGSLRLTLDVAGRSGNCLDPTSAVLAHAGFAPAELGRVTALVRERESEIVKEWHEYFKPSR